MQAVILAGGLGTRLQPYTDNTPKALVKVNGVPFLDYLISKLTEAGIVDILVCTGYLGEQIQGLYKRGEAFHCKIKYSHEIEPLGTGGALLNAMKLLELRFLLLNGDTYIDFDYSTITKVPCSTRILMAVRTGSTSCRNVRLEENKVVGFKKEGDASYNACDAGLYVVTRDLFTSNGPTKFSLESDVFPTCAKNGDVSGFLLPVPFYDIGTPRGLKEFSAYASEHARPAV
jgi:NDP-sugar pyrophosphorylase family protein